MNPSSNETFDVQQAAPIDEETAQAHAEVEAAFEIGEQEPAVDQQPAGSPATPLIPLPAPPSSQPPAAQDDSVPVMPTTDLQIADDGDLIEKDWVDKAKAIVERTRGDPHKQTEELTEFKADYMHKRYNKTIKSNK